MNGDLCEIGDFGERVIGESLLPVPLSFNRFVFGGFSSSVKKGKTKYFDSQQMQTYQARGEHIPQNAVGFFCSRSCHTCISVYHPPNPPSLPLPLPLPFQRNTNKWLYGLAGPSFLAAARAPRAPPTFMVCIIQNQSANFQAMGDVTKAIQSLAAQVSSAEDAKVLQILLRLRKTLQNSRLDSRERERAFHLIWQTDLLHVLVGMTRRDFSRLPGGWEKAAQLAELLATVCSGLRPQESPKKRQHAGKKKPGAETKDIDAAKDFHDKLLPAAVDSLLILANSLSEHTAASAVPKSRARSNSSLQSFQSVLISLSHLCSSHRECALKTIQSPHVLSMIATNQPQYCLAVVTTMNHLLTADRTLFASAVKHQPPTLVDVLAHKLTCSDGEEELQSECLKLLAAFADPKTDTFHVLCSKYATLANVVLRFKQRGLGERVELLVQQLEVQSLEEKDGDTESEIIEPEAILDHSPSVEHQTIDDQDEPVLTVDMATLHQAAAVIQASWRHYSARQKLKQTDGHVRHFQPQYQEIEVEQRQFGSLEIDAVMTKQLQSLSEMRVFHEKQMSLIEQLPANKVSSFLLGQRTSAATRIQSWWKGKLGREKCRQRRKHAQMVTAAVVIQRAVCKFLRGKRNSQQVKPSAVSGRAAIEDQERDRLQAEVVRYREDHPPPQYSDDQLRSMHNEVQHLLGEFYKSQKTAKEMERTQLLSKLERDCDLLLSLPRLSEAGDEEMERFTSGSQAVAKMARQMHREEVRATEQPWWKLPLPGSQDELLELLN